MSDSEPDSVQPSLAELRWDYAVGTLHREDLNEDPLMQFKHWFDQTLAAKIREPNAMTLSTVGLDGAPNARTVLMKDYTVEGVTFFTNYASRKGIELAQVPRASLLFFWKELERQVQIRGNVEKVSGEESDEYYNSRPYQSRIGAWASRQSEEIPGRKWLDERVAKYETRYPDTGQPDCVPRPDFWGGYRLVPDLLEFWQGQPGRKHDRFIYRKADGVWSVNRHSP
jgi:pyridoxamine 5'-phosphate oxidase